ncbi:MAG: protein jag [Terriglobales bacterium]
MPIPDKIAAARQIDALLKMLIAEGGFRLHYRIVVDPPLPEERDWKRPEIAVDLSGPDSSQLLERGAELLRAFEHVALKALRLESEEHEKVSFDCMNHKAVRLEELRLAASVAAEKVLKTGVPYEFSPMSARERRVLHLALGQHPDLRTESQGEGGHRFVVIYPRDYKPGGAKAAGSRVTFRRRR